MIASGVLTNQNFPGLLGKLGEMTSIRDTELLEQSLLKTLAHLLGLASATLYRADESHTLVRLIVHRCANPAESRNTDVVEITDNLHDIPEDIIAITRQVETQLTHCTQTIGNHYRTAYPLMGRNSVCGFFIFERTHPVTPVDDMTIQGVLEVFSNYYALLELSLRDRLTGLFNRQALENSYERIWTAMGQSLVNDDHKEDTGQVHTNERRHSGEFTACWLGVIDVDFFKRINDTFGHMVGDEILILVARLLTQTFRRSDLVYRYGGEEFVALIEAENVQTARMIFERVRTTVETYVFPRVEHLTISIGFAKADPHVLPQEVFGRADRCVYHAKQQGRNQVHEYGDLIAQGIFVEQDSNDVELF